MKQDLPEENSQIVYREVGALLNPRSIAIIGASDDVRKPAGLPLYYALRNNYPGRIYPVNPKREVVQGMKCYPTIADIPDEIDAALIVVAADHVPALVQECAEKGVKAAVIPVSGFAEVGGEGIARQRRIAEIAEISGMRVCGPNTNGLLNVYGKVSLGYSYAHEVAKPGPVAYVAQSGALLSASVPRLADRGVGFSYIIAAGNEVDLEVFDYVRYVLDDPNTRVIGLYVEGFREGKKFLDVAARARAAGKPLVLLKVGRSDLAARAALSHTGSLVGSDAAVEAACLSGGVFRVSDFDELAAACLALSICSPPRGNRVGIISTSGGAISLVADHAYEKELLFPELTASTKAEIIRLAPAYEAIDNPFDIGSAGATATRDRELCEKMIRMFASDPNLDLIVACVTPIDPRGTENYLAAITKTARELDKPFLLFCPMGRLREAERPLVDEAPLPMLFDAAECVLASQSLLNWATATGMVSFDGESLRLGGSASSIPRTQSSVPEVLSTEAGTAILREHRLPLAREEFVANSAEAVDAAIRIGFPVALKVVSPSIQHKSDVGGVVTGIADILSLREALDGMETMLSRTVPSATISGYVVQEMVQGGAEFIIGMKNDPQFGPLVLLGSGGVLTELVKDTVARLAPLTLEEATKMVASVRGSKLLDGFRGGPRLDKRALVETLVRFSTMCIEMSDELTEIDLNPVIVLPQGQGVRIVDNLMLRNAT